MSCRIAMIAACPYPVPQGSQVLLRDTALALRGAGHDVHLVVYGYGVGEDSSGLPIHRCARIPGARKTAAGPSFAKPLLDAALVATLRRVIREQRIDIVHAHNYEGLMAALAARTRPIVYHAHNAMADELPHFLPAAPLARRLGGWLDRTFPRRADHVIAPHQALADYLVSCGCDPSRVPVIPPPPGPAPFLRAPQNTPGDHPSRHSSVGPRSRVAGPRTSTTDSMALPDNAPDTVNDRSPFEGGGAKRRGMFLAAPLPILYTGNLDPYQNLTLLRDAMDHVRARVTDARLIIATSAPGTGPCSNAEHVPTPDLESLCRVLAQDAVVVCPRTSWSGYPMKLLNAMAAGRPVVSCQSAAHPISDEHDGLVVPDNDATALAEALLRLLTDPALRASLGANASETIATRHRPETIAAQIESVYAGLR